jgi:hypothetical protein
LLSKRLSLNITAVNKIASSPSEMLQRSGYPRHSIVAAPQDADLKLFSNFINEPIGRNLRQRKMSARFTGLISRRSGDREICSASRTQRAAGR